MNLSYQFKLPLGLLQPSLECDFNAQPVRAEQSWPALERAYRARPPLPPKPKPLIEYIEFEPGLEPCPAGEKRFLLQECTEAFGRVLQRKPSAAVAGDIVRMLEVHLPGRIPASNYRLYGRPARWGRADQRRRRAKVYSVLLELQNVESAVLTAELVRDEAVALRGAR